MSINRLFIIDNVAGKGRGLIANKPIKQGEIILRDPAIEIKENDREYLNKTVMRTHYHFYKTEQTMEYYVCFGPGSLLNHDKVSNVSKCFEQDELGPWLVVSAARDIEPGEELCLTYLDPSFFGLDD